MTKGACLRSFEHVFSGSSVKQFVVPFVFVPVRMCVRVCTCIVQFRFVVGLGKLF